MFRLALKSVWARKVKLGLLVGIIMASVGFIVGTFTFTNTINSGFNNLFGTVYKDTAVVVRGQKISNDPDENAFGQRNLIPKATVDKVKAVAGVKTAEGQVVTSAAVLDKANKVIPSNQGTAVRKWLDSPANPYPLVEGHKPEKAGEIVINRALAKKGSLKVGETVKVAVGDQPESFTIVGVNVFGSTDGDGFDMFVDEATAFRLAGTSEYRDILVTSNPGTSQDQLRASIARAVGEPTKFDVVTGKLITDEKQKEINNQVKGFATFLLGFGLIALLVGIFVISNTFSILIAQRQRELALLRAVGASRRQVLRSVLAESVVVGVLGSILGLGFGLVTAKGLQALFAAVGADGPKTALKVTPGTLVLGIIVGIISTILSAVVPALRASSVPPIAAIRGAALDSSGSSRVRVFAGALIVTLGAVLLGVGLNAKSNAVQFSAASFLCVVVGVSVLGPTLVKPIMKVLGAPLPKLRGMTGKLAQQNAIRNPRRTSASSLALTIGVAVVAFFIVVGASLKTSLNATLDKSFVADYIIQSDQTGLNPDVATKLKAVKNVASVSAFRDAQITIDGKNKQASAVDPKTITDAVILGKTDGKLADLEGENIAVLSELATQRGWKIGTTLNAKVGLDNVPLKIVALYEDKDLLGNYVISTATLAKHDPQSTKDAAIVVKLSKGTDVKATRADINAALKPYPTVTLQDLAEFKSAQAGQVNQILALVSAMLVLAIGIALIGIAITLSLSIFERVRELGVLRAVGQQRKQTRSTVRWEAVLVSVLGTLTGLAIGTGFGVAIVRAARNSGISRIALAPGQLLAVALLGALAGIGASLFPSYKASKTDIMAALAV
jgi:putative ABC transport system permease protein